MNEATVDVPRMAPGPRHGAGSGHASPGARQAHTQEGTTVEHGSLFATQRARGVVSSIVALGATLLLAGTTLAGGWSTPLELGSSGFYTPANSHSSATVGSKIHALLWNDQSVAYLRSTDAGATYPNEVSLAAKTATVTYFPIAIAASGQLVAALYKSTGPGNKRTLLLRRSTNGGTTWSPKQTIASYTSAANDMGDGGVAVSGTRIFVAWTDRTNGKVLLRRSTNSGATFKPNQLIGTTTNPFLGKDGELDVAASGARVYVVWIPLSGKGIALRRSTDSGATWKPKQTISTAKVTFRGPVASASGQTLLVLYTLDTYAVKVARSANGGTSISSATVVPADSDNGEDVLVSGSQARLTYKHFGNVTMRSSTNGGATWGAAETGIAYGADSNLSLVPSHTVIVFGVEDEFTATAFSTRSN